MVTLKSNNLPYYLSVLGRTLVFWGSPTCRMCKEAIKEIDEEKLRELKLDFLYIDGTRWDQLCDDWEIEVYPTIMIFDDNMDMEEKYEGNEIENLFEELNR